MQPKKTFLRDISAYAEHLFQSWKDKLDEDDPSSSQGTSWFKKQVRPYRAANEGCYHKDRRSFQFCEEEDEMDFDVGKMFRSAFGHGSAFGRNQHFYGPSLVKSSSRYGNNYWNCGNWRSQVEEDHEKSTESESSNSDMSLNRQAHGLSASGPLKHKDVKNACRYRACALKWHPDRHQGSSKAVAEEKFKLCSQAYQALCDKLAVN